MTDCKSQLSYRQAWKSSGFRKPFVRCADISLNKGVTCHYAGLLLQPLLCVNSAYTVSDF